MGLGRGLLEVGLEAVGIEEALCIDKADQDHSFPDN